MLTFLQMGMVLKLHINIETGERLTRLLTDYSGNISKRHQKEDILLSISTVYKSLTTNGDNFIKVLHNGLNSLPKKSVC